MEGFHRLKTTADLTKEARQIEEIADDLSESLWKPIKVAVSAIYERIENSLKRQPGKPWDGGRSRAHYHNLRLRLLEQLLGARMLVLNSDLGDESERIWRQSLSVIWGGNCVYSGAGIFATIKGTRRARWI